jgi:uncharacterized protein YecE (DUF72 family)
MNRRDYFSHYSKYFDTVEINSTFYRLPFRNFVLGWARKAPQGFLYAIKVNRRVTHIKRLRDTEGDLANFLERLEPLKKKGLLGPLLLQLPPGLHLDLNLLECFLNSLPESYRFTIEFRHKSWLIEDVYRLLERYNVAFCIVSSPKLPVVVRVTADFSYIRMHGRKRWYDYFYTDEELRYWADVVSGIHEEGKDVFMYFNNDPNAYAIQNALRTKELLDLN